MSKMDGLRAMREARYEQRVAKAPRPTTPPKGPAKPATTPIAAARPTTKPAKSERPETEPQPVAEKLCGHRAISGRTCTREHGHAAKSHRYS